MQHDLDQNWITELIWIFKTGQINRLTGIKLQRKPNTDGLVNWLCQPGQFRIA